MAFNGSGTFSLVAGNPAVTGTTISSTWANNTLSDIANNGLTNCLTKDGQTTPTANIKLGGFKLINVGAPSTTNDALTFGTAGTMTTLTASTSVVTPLITTSGAVNLGFSTNGAAAQWAIVNGSNALTPAVDNTQQIGAAASRLSAVFTPIIDSGTTGALSLKTNNGTVGLTISNTASAVNAFDIFPNSTGSGPVLRALGETNVPANFATAGTGSHQFFTNGTSVVQFQILHTASATRNITITGSNGGNPTISTTGGGLEITPDTIIRGNLSIGSAPASAGSGVRLEYTGGIISRNQANSGNIGVIGHGTVNSVTNVLTAGDANDAGMIWKARSGGAAPTTSDLPSGFATVWRDTGGATTKLYYNNAGSIQSVALA